MPFSLLTIISQILKMFEPFKNYFVNQPASSNGVDFLFIESPEFWFSFIQNLLEIFHCSMNVWSTKKLKLFKL